MRRRVRRHQPRGDVVVNVGGVEWLERLLEPSVQVVSGGRQPAGIPMIDVTEDCFDVFVQPRLANPTQPWCRVGAPIAFEQQARDAAMASLHPLGPDLERWLADSSRGHVAYRCAHAVTADAMIDAAMAKRELPVAADRRAVTVVCVTMRPDRFDDVLANFDRQVHADKRLIVITNSDGFDRWEVETRTRGRGDISVVHTPPSTSLGRCLNMGLEQTETRYMAKFDDDDQYGPYFLHDLLIAHTYADAGVVGKHSYYAHLREQGRTVLRFAGAEFMYTPYLAGGSLVIDLERTGNVRFPDISLGEDQAFIAACHRRGVATFAADRFNFVQERNGENTWNPPLDYFLSSCTSIGTGGADELVHI
jgi:hypothetical protein